MSEPTVVCPKCQSEIRLTESLAAPLVAATRRDYEQKFAGKEREIEKREEAVRTIQRQVEEAKRALEVQIAQRVSASLEAERPRLIAEAADRARASAAADLDAKARELADLKTLLKARSEKLAQAQLAEADFLRLRRELDDEKRELNVTVEKRVNSNIDSIRIKARQEADEALGLKISEKEQVIQSMQRQIEELRRKADQGSQQLQGEVQELELEQLLAGRFPRDTITPVPKGEFGGDVVQTVMSPMGSVCGTILWESKRTKNWSDGWLTKLREDQRAAKADIAVIVSQALPKDTEHFNLIDEVYVASPRCIAPIAVTLRQALIEVSAARQSISGQQTKMELVYQYLTGPRFRQRIQAIVEAFTSMQDDLASERKAITKQWAKRSTQIESVMESTVGLYGDLQGIAGKTLQEIEGLNFDALDGPVPGELPLNGRLI